MSNGHATGKPVPRKVAAGGRGGIRTHGGFNPTLDFESSALNRTQPPFRLSRARAIIVLIGALIIKCGVTFVNSGRGLPHGHDERKGTDFKPVVAAVGFVGAV
jgi:hypothetical protein